VSKRQPVDVIVIPDAHVPHHNKRAWRCVLGLLSTVQPKQIVIIGDFLDLESLNHHPRNVPEITHLKPELEAGNHALDQIYEASPSSRVTYLEGNHEYRVTKYINTASPELEGLLDVPGFLRLKDRRILWVPFRSHIRHPWISPWDVAYLHSAKANSRNNPGGSHAAFHANTIGPSSRCATTVYGHHHTFQHYRSSAGYEAFCCGFLGDYDSDDPTFDYEAGPTLWTIGCLYQRSDRGIITTTNIPIVNGRHGFF
jgi:predicted phosphodiesterase